MSDSPLLPDRAQLARFIAALFRRADPAGFVSLRVFGGADDKLLREEAVALGAPGFLDRVAAMALVAAQMDVVRPSFAPPVATFANPHRARVVDLLEGVAIVAECDARPAASLARLRAVLGPPTVVVESGGRWSDPEAGASEAKLHVYWRLATPARTAEELRDLRTARRLACDLVLADASAVALVHPLRWPGSWHRKAEPRLARIAEENDVELDLADALARLRAVPDGDFLRPPTEARAAAAPNPDRAADAADVAAALRVIPNDDWAWDEWNKLGMAVFAATGGDWVDGFLAFNAWSEKSWKHDPSHAEERWSHWEGSPPKDLGAGTVFHTARRFEPGWVKPSARFDPAEWFEEPAPDRPKDDGSGLFGEDRRTAPDPPLTITATSFRWRDPATFPRRRWLYGSHLIRKFVSCTVAPGGVGKSSLVLVEAIAMVTGRPLLGTLPAERPLRIWVINLEDPQEEIERRVLAILVHYKIDPAEVEGRLFIDSGRRLKVIVAEQTKDGTQIAIPVVKALREEIQARSVDAVMIDPFVKAHRVPENDNGAIDAVCTVFADLADLCDCAFDLVHHVRKTNGAEVTVEDGRGAVALLGAVRSARAVNGMSKDEAAKVGEGTSPREFFRVDNGKLNMAPAPPDRAEWFRLVSVPLGNGDNVQCVVTWRWPDAMAGSRSSTFARCRRRWPRADGARTIRRRTGWVAR